MRINAGNIPEIPSMLKSFQAQSGRPDKIVVFHAKTMEDKSLSGVVEIGTITVQLSDKKAHSLYVTTILKIVFSVGFALLFESIKNNLTLSKTRLVKEPVFLDLNAVGKRTKANHSPVDVITKVQDIFTKELDRQNVELREPIKQNVEIKIRKYKLFDNIKNFSSLINNALTLATWKTFEESIMANATKSNPRYDVEKAKEIIMDFQPLLKEHIEGVNATLDFQPYV